MLMISMISRMLLELLSFWSHATMNKNINKPNSNCWINPAVLVVSVQVIQNMCFSCVFQRFGKCSTPIFASIYHNVKRNSMMLYIIGSLFPSSKINVVARFRKISNVVRNYLITIHLVGNIFEFLIYSPMFAAARFNLFSTNKTANKKLLLYVDSFVLYRRAARSTTVWWSVWHVVCCIIGRLFQTPDEKIVVIIQATIWCSDVSKMEL